MVWLTIASECAYLDLENPIMNGLSGLVYLICFNTIYVSPGVNFMNNIRDFFLFFWEVKSPKMLWDYKG